MVVKSVEIFTVFPDESIAVHYYQKSKKVHAP